MLITKETDYALRTLRALAGGSQLTAEQLAAGEQIPRQFAYKILKKLQKGGLVRILRGAGGGFLLETSLKKVTLYQLMQVMGEDFSVVDCMKPGYACTWQEHHGGALCCAHQNLAGIQQRLNEELNAHSLEEILFGN
ncbi:MULTISPECIES: RrF2 family transcriptional regulator [Caproicibacterium]|uniref:Rrf2 family transcriptional regulator n=1 Tax=Caproicibacterium argilliputei TaxID=3030016 RepID=A0AA97D919_9FIRM|nr:Rrf2 family transcriptional regulator [Caproicibacterium argilliputei]WOC32471.1 Rrf2 family transcriptional regulator [Caproicibacterium argilliputei]